MPQYFSPTVRKVVEPKRILLQGAPGTGKTTLAMQFPNPWIIDVDGNLDGAEEYIRERIARKPGTNDTFSYLYDNPRIKNGKTLNSNECWENLMNIVLGMKADKENMERFDWVFVDSLLLVNQYNVHEVMKRRGVEELETRHLDAIKSNYNKLLSTALRDLGKGIIVSVHDKKIFKPSDKNMMEKVLVGYEPNVLGGIRDAFGGIFSDVWACETRSGLLNRVERVIKTCADPKRDLKNTMGMPPEIIIKENQSAWEALAPWHDKLMGWKKAA